MLALSDPRWSNFQANYTNGQNVATLLLRAERGDPPDLWYDSLFQELCHQYTVSDAAYPAAAHVLRLATAQEELRKPLLVLLGACHAFCDPVKVTAVPTEIAQEWRSSARHGMPLVAALLAQPQQSASDLLSLLSSLAAMNGYPSLASLIEGLDYDAE